MNPLLLPVIAVQAMWVRSTTETLPPASGPTAGTVGDGSRQHLRIAVVGESTAAGCGVGTHDDGFAGCLARELSTRTHRPVTWKVLGEPAATARRIRFRLVPRLGDNLNVAVLLAGVNDVLSRRTPEGWRDDLAAIVGHPSDRADHVAVTGVPPFEASRRSRPRCAATSPNAQLPWTRSPSRYVASNRGRPGSARPTSGRSTRISSRVTASTRRPSATAVGPMP